MSKFFINRPIFAIVISLIIVLLGLVSLVSLPIAQYPQISPPTVQVSANYSGANASIVNQTVAEILEEQLNGVEGMDYMSSTSSNSGSYSLSIVFDIDTDGDTDTVNVENSANLAKGSLPSGPDGPQGLQRHVPHGQSLFAQGDPRRGLPQELRRHLPSR